MLLARHYLGAEASGAYGVASLFAKAVLWSSQFVAQAAYPALASPAGRRRLLVRTLAATGGIGLAAVAFTAAAGGPVIHLLTGKQTYGAAVGLAPAFALLGVAWSLAQALLLAAVAAGDHRPGRLLWGVIAAEAATVAAWLHGSAAQILAACLLGVGAFAAVVAVLEFRAPGRVPAPAATAGPPPPNQ